MKQRHKMAKKAKGAGGASNVHEEAERAARQGFTDSLFPLSARQTAGRHIFDVWPRQFDVWPRQPRQNVFTPLA